jgi:hypothetical protein
MLRKIFTPLLLLLLSMGLWTCANPPEYPIEPSIRYLGISQNLIDQNGSYVGKPDTIEIRFAFTDGDGDLGSTKEENVYITDSRTDIAQPFTISPIPQLGAGEALQGEISIKLINKEFTGSFCCLDKRSNQICFVRRDFPSDTLSFFIQIKDEKGHLSNRIKTDRITILCK